MVRAWASREAVRRWGPPALIAAVSFGVYVNALGNGLHVDDQYQIVTNPWIRSLRNLPVVFSSGVWDFDGRISAYYRPMMYVLYGLVYAVAGTEPWAYHLLNVLLHALTSALVFLVARRLLAPQAGRESWWHAPAFLTGLLFAVHPIHSEPVAWAAGVVDLSYAFFYLLAFHLLTRADGRPRVTALALASYGAALLSKEPAITLPAVALLYWWLRDGRELGVRGMAWRVAPLIAVSAVYLAVRSVVLGGIAPRTSPVQLSPLEYVLSAITLLARFLRAQLWPAELNFWHVFEPVRSIVSAEAGLALFAVGTWGLLLALALWRRVLAPSVGLAVAVVPLAPALLLGSLSQGIENAFAERYVYLPSFGACLLAGWAVASVHTRRPGIAQALTIGLGCVAVVGAGVTVERNPVWKDSLSLWRDAVAKSPGSGVPNLYYGFALMSAGQADAGRPYVERAVVLAPHLVEREMRRAVSYAQAERWRDAILAFHRVLVMDPRSAQAHYNLGLVYEQRQMADKAITEYQAAIQLDPAQADAHNNVAILYFTMGARDRAVTHLREAVRLRPADPTFRANLARALATSAAGAGPR